MTDSDENRNENGERLKLSEIAQTLINLAHEENKLTTNLINLAGQRTELSQRRTALADDRTGLAGNRTDLSCYRSLLARGRTELAFICTGLAFITFGVGLMCAFGFGPWTLLYGTLIVLGAISTVYGLKRFAATSVFERRFSRKLKDFLSLETQTEEQAG